MLTETLSIWRKNFFVFVGHAVLIVILVKLVGEPESSGSWLGIYGAVQLHLAFLVQRSVIFETSFFGRNAPKGGSGFNYVSVGMAQGLIILALTFFAGMTFVGQMMSYDSPKAVFVVSIILVDFFFGKLLLGTWLPASIKGTNTNLFDALARGFRGFQRLFSQVLAIVLARLIVVGCAVAVLNFASRDDGHSPSQNTALLLGGLFVLINLFLGSMVDVLFAKEVKNEVDKPLGLLSNHLLRWLEADSTKMGVSASTLGSRYESWLESNRAPELSVPQSIPSTPSEEQEMRNAPVAAIIYELLYDLYQMMESGAGFDEWYDDENGVPCRTFCHGFTSKWEWSTGILAIVGAIKPFYPPHLRDRPPSQRSTPYYLPVMTLEQCLEADFDAFETFDNYCFAMFTFDQFLDNSQFSPLFVENFVKMDDVFCAERPKNGQFLVEWDWERYEEKVMSHWYESSHEFKPKD